MRATESAVAPLRERAADIFGSMPQVEEWEIAVMHRDHTSGAGACVRSTWLQGAQADVDRSIDVFKLTTLPALEEFDGLLQRQPARQPGHRTRAGDGRLRQPRRPATPPRQGANALRERTATEMSAGVQAVQ